MKSFIQILFFLLIFSLGAKTISLKQEIYTENDYIYYQDLTDEILPQKEAKIIICRSPFRQNEKVVEINTIIRNLENKHASNLPKKSSEAIIIKNKMVNFSIQEQQDLVKAEIAKLVAKFPKKNKYEYQFKSKLKNVPFPKRAKISIKVLEKERFRASGNQLFHIEIRLNGRFYKKIFVNTYISIFGKALIAKQKISRGTSITPLYFQEVEGIDISGYENEIISMNDLKTNSYLANKLIYNGKILRKSMIKRKPDIKKNQIINLNYKKGIISLKLPAKALNDSFIGEEARFKIIASGKIQKCQVIDKKNVLFE